MPTRGIHKPVQGILYVLPTRCKSVLRNLRSPLLAMALLIGFVIVPGAFAQDKLFNDAPKKDGGWQGLANLLEALAPNADTSIPLTPSEITDRIAAMLDQGKNQDALNIIEKREAQRKASGAAGTDVQLLFLKGRALAALNRHDEAIATYRSMTVLFPELPEPWNNLASEYTKQGKLDMARDALQMALTADPNYATARANMGEVQLMLAQRSFHEAATLGSSSAHDKASEIKKVIEQK